MERKRNRPKPAEQTDSSFTATQQSTQMPTSSQPANQVASYGYSFDTIGIHAPLGVTAQREKLEDKDQIPVQAFNDSSAAPNADASVSTRIQNTLGAGQPLDSGARDVLEPKFGHSFENVRIHADGEADALSKNLGARAFTTGQDIFFRSGEYQPGSSGGQHLLAHELTHTIQQARGAVDGVDRGDGVRVSDPSDEFEQEAENVAKSLQFNEQQSTGKNDQSTSRIGEFVDVQRQVVPSTTSDEVEREQLRTRFTGHAIQVLHSEPISSNQGVAVHGATSEELHAINDTLALLPVSNYSAIPRIVVADVLTGRKTTGGSSVSERTVANLQEGRTWRQLAEVLGWEQLPRLELSRNSFSQAMGRANNRNRQDQRLGRESVPGEIWDTLVHETGHFLQATYEIDSFIRAENFPNISYGGTHQGTDTSGHGPPSERFGDAYMNHFVNANRERSPERETIRAVLESVEQQYDPRQQTSAQRSISQSSKILLDDLNNSFIIQKDPQNANSGSLQGEAEVVSMEIQLINCVLQHIEQNNSLLDRGNTITSLPEDYMIQVLSRNNRSIDLEDAILEALTQAQNSGLSDAIVARLATTIEPILRRQFINDPQTSSLDLLPLEQRNRYRSFSWETRDFPGSVSGGPDGTYEALSVEMRRNLNQIRPERRANSGVDAVVTRQQFTRDEQIREHILHELQEIPAFPTAEVDQPLGERLNQQALQAFVLMRTKALEDGVALIVIDSYREPEVAEANARRSGNTAAVASFSSHTLGLAIDLKMSYSMHGTSRSYTEANTHNMQNVIDMRESPVHKWIFLNGAEYGWYPYNNEPWHWEYNPPGFRDHFSVH